ncbi:MAG: DUF3105 domain-containing protein [Chloroflexi bacterium]|nr:DUF3105 domain-containing protein [Chloroflexota bacterium]
MSEPVVTKKSNRMLWIVVGGLVVMCVCVCLIALGIGGYFFITQNNFSLPQSRATIAPQITLPAARKTSIAPSNSTSCADLQFFTVQGYDHIAPNQVHAPYNSNPPTSGWHWVDPQNWGIYTSPQVQEQLVHNLEHGGIVIQYKNLSPAEIQHLNDLVKRDSHHMLLAPYPALPSDVKIAVTAWTVLLNCTGVDEEIIAAFIELFRDQGPETVP